MSEQTKSEQQPADTSNTQRQAQKGELGVIEVAAMSADRFVETGDELPQAAIPPQSPATLLAPSTLGRTKHWHSPTFVVVLILLTLLLLGGGYVGIYGAVTGNWPPWNASSGQSNTSAQTNATSMIWHAQHVGPAQSLAEVAWSGSQFVAVGYSGAILTSPDGRSWTAQPTATALPLLGVVWSGSQFVIVGGSGTILTSS